MLFYLVMTWLETITDLKREEVSRSGARLLFQTINPKKFFKNPKKSETKNLEKFFLSAVLQFCNECADEMLCSKILGFGLGTFSTEYFRQNLRM
jgi:hypothetical protein